MLNRTAALYRQLGVNASRAAYLEGLAAALVPQVLGLYVAPQGVWNCSYPAPAPPVTVRTVVDFVYCSAALFEAIPAAQAAEMGDFVQRELRTPTWLRALSPRDAAANFSDRDDHGPLGSYDGWPAGAILGLSHLGNDSAALDLLASVQAVLSEGPFGQAHHVYDNASALGVWAIKGGRNSAQTYLESVGGAFADAILQSVFQVRALRELFRYRLGVPCFLYWLSPALVRLQVGRGTRGGQGSALRGNSSLMSVRVPAGGGAALDPPAGGRRHFAALRGLREAVGGQGLVDVLVSTPSVTQAGEDVYL